MSARNRNNVGAQRKKWRNQNQNAPDNNNLQTLLSMFGDVLEKDVIHSVAHGCNWNLQKAVEVLISFSEKVEKSPPPSSIAKNLATMPRKKNLNSSKTVQTVQYGNDDSDADVVIEEENEYDFKTLTASSSTSNLSQQGAVGLSFAKVAKVPISDQKHTFQKKQNMPKQTKLSPQEIYFNKIVSDIRQGVRVLVLLRGLPGSGKSFLARRIFDSTVSLSDPKYHIYSTDGFFVWLGGGQYRYDRTRLSDAHSWNQQRVKAGMEKGISPIIVDNTNVCDWEMHPYLVQAVQNGYTIEVLEPWTPWAFNDRELAKRNSHNVPRIKIKEMLENYQKNLNGMRLLSIFQLQYRRDNYPPQQRLFPPIVIVPRDITTPKIRNRQRSRSRCNRFKNNANARSQSSTRNELTPEHFNIKVSNSNENVSTSNEEEKLIHFSDSEDDLSDDDNSTNVVESLDLISLEVPSDNCQLKNPGQFICLKNELAHKLHRGDDIFESFNLPNVEKTEIICMEFVVKVNNEWIDGISKDDYSIKYGSESNTEVGENCAYVPKPRRDNLKRAIPDDVLALERELAIKNNENDQSESEESSWINELKQKQADKVQGQNEPKPQRKNFLSDKTDNASPDMICNDNSNAFSLFPENNNKANSVKNIISFSDENYSSEKSEHSVGLSTKQDTKLYPSLESEFLKLENVELNNSVPENNGNSEVAQEATESDGNNKKNSDSFGLTQSLRELFLSKDKQPSSKNTSFWSFLSLKKDSAVETNEATVSFESTKVDTADSSTNTGSADFNLLKQKISTEFKTVIGNPRDINSGCVKSMTDRTPPKVLMLDKSSLTEDGLIYETNDKEADFAEFVNLFPSHSVESLRDIYTLCNCDVNWVTDLLLDNKNVNLPKIVPPKKEIVPSAPPSELETDNKFDHQQVQKTKKVKYIYTSEELLDIKRQMEEQFVIDDSYYSEHCLKIKRQRHGEETNTSVIAEPVSNISELVAPPSREISPVLDSDENSESTEDDDAMELNLGTSFVSQLESNFGGATAGYPEGLQPVIQVPMSLARQLYALWIESVHQQLTAQEERLSELVREDEEFARRLQNEEYAPDNGLKTPNIQEIIDMEIALALAKSDLDKNNHETADTLATRLTKQKLVNLFPEIDPEMIFDIYGSNDKKFEQTVEDLLNSTGRSHLIRVENGRTSVEAFISKEMLLKQEQELLNEAKRASSVVSKKLETIEETVDLSPHDNVDLANFYRNEATEELRLRDDCYNKAKVAFKRKQGEVAQYYSQVAQIHTRRYEQANSRAAAVLLASRDNATTLDLHFYRVAEAIQALDIFVDERVTQLRNTSKPYEELFLITGRGKHSVNNVSKIKPAVIKRLNKRNIQFHQVNSGFLKIKITKQIKLTMES